MKKKVLIPTLIVILASSSLIFSHAKATSEPKTKTPKINNVVAAETQEKNKNNSILEIGVGIISQNNKITPTIFAHEKVNLDELLHNTTLTFENDVQIPIEITLGEINDFHGYVEVEYIVSPTDKNIEITKDTAYIVTVKKGVSSEADSNKKTIVDAKSHSVPKEKYQDRKSVV